MLQTDSAEEEVQNITEQDMNATVLDLNSNISSSCPGHQQQEEKNVGSNAEGLIAIGLGNGKLKARRTGFKPYKRCSVEAKENRLVNNSTQPDEKYPKRIRIEGEAST